MTHDLVDFLLHDIYLKLLVIPWLALMFRLRGGLLGDELHKIFKWWGSTPARIIFWGMGSGLAAWWLTNNELIAGSTIILFYLDSIFGWFDALAMGGQYGKIYFGRDFWLLVLRGVIWTLPIAIILVFFGYTNWWLFLLGAVCPLCYQLAYFITPPTLVIGGRNVIPWGEWLFGGVIGITFYLMVVT
jgi:hypothetical protein